MSETFSNQDDQLTRSYAAAAELDAQAAEVMGAQAVSAAAPGGVCDTWRSIRPIIEGASNLFFIPANIRRALKLVISLVDGICSGNNS